MDFEAISNVLEAHVPQLAAAYLYGSWARGDARADSDIDIAVVSATGPIDRDAIWVARGALSGLLGHDVDLVDLQGASLFLIREVLEEGVCFAAPQRLYADLFEIRSLRDYVDLKERLTPHLADIRVRGRVFGGTGG